MFISLFKPKPIYKAGTKVKVVEEISGLGTEELIPLDDHPVPVGTEGELHDDLYDLKETAYVRFPRYGYRATTLGRYVEVIERSKLDRFFSLGRKINPFRIR